MNGLTVDWYWFLERRNLPSSAGLVRSCKVVSLQEAFMVHKTSWIETPPSRTLRMVVFQSSSLLRLLRVALMSPMFGLCSMWTVQTTSRITSIVLVVQVVLVVEALLTRLLPPLKVFTLATSCVCCETPTKNVPVLIHSVKMPSMPRCPFLLPSNNLRLSLHSANLLVWP